MATERPGVDLLAAPDSLFTWMTRSRQANRPGNAAVGVFVAGAESIIQSDVEGVYDLAGDATPHETRLPVGCLAKTLTATLVLNAAVRGKFGLDTRITALIDVPVAATDSPFARVTVRQLLNHTHGLDASTLPQLPRTQRGFIDVERLHGHLASVPPLAQPGEIYSYSNAGAWLGAAILERVSGKTYGEFLDETILRPIGVQGRSLSEKRIPVCPAVGSGLNLSIVHLVGLARMQLGYLPRQIGGGPGGSSEAIVPMPGWSLEQGVWLAWKYYGDGWYGHNMSYGRASACLRIHPGRDRGIVVASDVYPAMLLLGRLCGSILPEFQRLRPPAESTHSLDRQTAGSFAGVYLTAALHAAVALTDDGSVELRLRDRSIAGSSATEVGSRLGPRAENVFMLDLGARSYFNWVQFIQPAQGHWRYLWNGKHVLRRQ
jgi:CubicO group peptidase (beta-lactamase class C family)